MMYLLKITMISTEVVFLVAITIKQHVHSTNNINLILTLIDINANLQLVVLRYNLTIGEHKVNE